MPRMPRREPSGIACRWQMEHEKKQRERGGVRRSAAEGRHQQVRNHCAPGLWRPGNNGVWVRAPVNGTLSRSCSYMLKPC